MTTLQNRMFTAGINIVVLNLSHVHRLTPVGVCLLTEARAARVQAGGELVVVDDAGDLAADFRALDPDIPVFDARTEAVDWAQGRLLATYGQGSSSDARRL